MSLVTQDMQYLEESNSLQIMALLTTPLGNGDGKKTE